MKVTRSVENERSLLQGTTRKITSEERRLLSFLGPLMTTGLPLMKSVLTPLAKNVSLPFALSAAMSATDAAIKKKKKKGSVTSALIISNEEMEDIMKIVK